MMKAKKKVATSKASRSIASSEPKFPYTTKPSSLRKLLKEIPKKPKPTKFDKVLVRSWGFSDTNDMTMLRVLRAVNLLNEKDEPTEIYVRFMSVDEGGKALAPEIRKTYSPLFQSSLAPYNEGTEKLKNLFNINSGGGEASLDFQIQTFKALCENTLFEATPASSSPMISSSGAPTTQAAILMQPLDQSPTVHINLHIHLPDNKSRRDYEDIIEDIGRYIFGRNTSTARE